MKKHVVPPMNFRDFFKRKVHILVSFMKNHVVTPMNFRDVFEESSKSNLRIKKICLPVEYRHHFERSVPPLGAHSYLYLEKKGTNQGESNRSIVDDFGVHSLSCQAPTKIMQCISKYEFHD